jgi:hypothetical protein
MGPISQSFIAVLFNIYRFFKNFQTRSTGHIFDLIELSNIGIDFWIGEANSQRLIVSENELYICILHVRLFIRGLCICTLFRIKMEEHDGKCWISLNSL